MSYWGASYNEALWTEIIIVIILLVTFLGILYLQWQADTTYNKEIKRLDIEYGRGERTG